jgi:copper chaperone NosL
MRYAVLVAILLLPWLTSCDDDKQASLPPPQEITAESTGFICGMLLQDHAGPKGQVHVADMPWPLWFSSVRDTIAFIRMPDEAPRVRAVYVNDMGKAQSWADPGPGTWINAAQAYYVLGSRRQGSMGAPEAVPFGDEAVARAFVAEQGGRIMRLDEIPDSYVIGPPQEDAGIPIAKEDGGHARH